jgi:prolyl 4-hydroxylase
MFVDYDAPMFVVIDDVLSPQECAEMLARLRSMPAEPATIDAGVGGGVLRPDLRNNTRVTFDDEALAAQLWTRLKDKTPASLLGWTALGLNERFRGYHYTPGQRFAPHADGVFQRSATERSMLSALIYLNGDCVGGETKLLDLEESITPAPGRALLFQHLLCHEGSEVTDGEKHVLRTDVMYIAPDR